MKEQDKEAEKTHRRPKPQVLQKLNGLFTRLLSENCSLACSSPFPGVSTGQSSPAYLTD